MKRSEANNAIEELMKLGQSVWFDQIGRGLIKSGELQRLVELGVSGLTSNPTIFEKAITSSADYDDALIELAREGKNAAEIFEAVATEDIRDAADLLRPVYDQTGGADGFASYEVSPHLAHDTEGTIAEAKRLFTVLDRPNVMIKVPATPEGIPAVRQLISDGINVNTTLIFSLEAYDKVREAYIGGLEELAKSGGDVSKPTAVASFFVSRVDSAVDSQIEQKADDGNVDLQELSSKAAIANAKIAFRDFKQAFTDDRFMSLRQSGAKVQRPLWASTSTKNPDLSDVLYVEELMGQDTVNTMPQATLTAFLEHGNVAQTLEQDLQDAELTIESLESAGISMRQVTSKLLADGVKSFADSYDALLENIDEKKARLLAAEHPHPGVSLGNLLPEVESTLAKMERDRVSSRIWDKDHTVWKPSPEEITDRLGWLNVMDVMDEQVGTLKAFADEVREAGFQHVVVLGMGGSSLGPEVLRQTFGKSDTYPELIVLDSTVPDSVKSVTDSIDPARTLFLVSSKSGTTIEPNSLYRHYRSLVEQLVDKDQVGQNFVAVTDPGTPLVNMAREAGFRRIFPNPSDIGGRYSVLSYFGLVPAALAGLDVKTLLERAKSMRETCAFSVPAHNNPGAWLGAVIGTSALQGRDKLTLVTSPSIESFGLWVEQLIAESTGKEGKGVLPVSGEPLMSPERYGDDRLFVYVRLDNDNNSVTDAAIERIELSGQPIVRLSLRDKYDLGAEFYRWEFATAVAGAVLEINPFDQPNVQQAKDKTNQVLEEYRELGRMPVSDPSGSISELLASAQDGDYLAILAYVQQTPEMDQALSDLRQAVMNRHGIATTLGYGPRFLHSTGQLHKGGPKTGLFLQLTAIHEEDLSIPGEPYTFGVLADAQALGDLQTLQVLGRRVARIHLGTDPVAELGALLDASS
jgi:transaldolase/glucose-6-phosphate isomerase